MQLLQSASCCFLSLEGETGNGCHSSTLSWFACTRKSAANGWWQVAVYLNGTRSSQKSKLATVKNVTHKKGNRVHSGWKHIQFDTVYQSKR